MSASAYGAVQAGTYNSRALVPEVLVRANEWALVRPRVTAAELIALDRFELALLASARTGASYVYFGMNRDTPRSGEAAHPRRDHRFRGRRMP